MTALATSATDVDRALSELTARKQRWAAGSFAERIRLLESVVRRTDFAAERWIDAASIAKQFKPDSAAAAEEWFSGPFAIIAGAQAYAESLRRLAAGKNTYSRRSVRQGKDGRAIVRVLPFDWYDPILLSGYSVDVWMQAQVTPAALAENTAAAYRIRPNPRVCAVMGAGNVGSIPALDALYKLIDESQVVILKMSPINDYLGALLEEILVEFIDLGCLRIVYGDSDIGASLIEHELVDTVHLTGSRATHDAIVWGTGDESERRRANGEPRLEKPVTSELGGVSPIIVVPGPWTAADYRYQAEQIATAKLINVGYNCIAPQILVLPEGWDGSGKLVETIGEVIDELEPRFPYYPGGEERRRQVAERPGAVTVGGFPTAILPHLAAGTDESAFKTEWFTPALGVVRLPFTDPAYFLQSAVQLANNQLEGSLGANLIIHPKTADDYGPHLEGAIANLRYGAVAVNTWTAVNFLFPRASWGAFPGHSVGLVGSGVGVVHNALFFDRPEKSVARGPFSPMPRAWRQGEVHLSPPPPWGITAQKGAEVARRSTRFIAAPRWQVLSGIMAAALKG
ncbi:MAG: aldehyde dehydrogenase family protein [Actinobacteria bacterium]|nr:aldehyde dehydrogenase family protein [Actinomycetota bacterium]